MWQDVQDLINEATYPINDKEFMKIYFLVNPLLKALVETYYRKMPTGQNIVSRSDLESGFLEILWYSILACQKDSKLCIKKVFFHRIKLKNYDFLRKSYSQKKWDMISLDCFDYEMVDHILCNEVMSVKESTTNKIEFRIILKDFKKKYPKEGKSILLLLSGWTPAEIAKINYHDTSYSSTSRQKIRRLRLLFCRFYNNYGHL